MEKQYNPNINNPQVLTWSSFLNEENEIVFFLNAENYCFKSYILNKHGIILEEKNGYFLLQHPPILFHSYIHIAELTLTGEVTKEHIVHQKK